MKNFFIDFLVPFEIQFLPNEIYDAKRFDSDKRIVPKFKFCHTIRILSFSYPTVLKKQKEFSKESFFV